MKYAYKNKKQFLELSKEQYACQITPTGVLLFLCINW